MRLGSYELRKPWVKMVDLPIERQLYMAIRKSVLEDVLQEVQEAADRVMEKDEEL